MCCIPILRRGTDGGVFGSSGCAAAASGGCCAFVGGDEASCVSMTSEDGDEVGVCSIRRRFGALSASSSSLSCLRLIASGAGDDEDAGEDEDCVDDVLGDEPGSGTGTGSNSVVVVGAGTGGADVGEDDSGAGGTWTSTASGGGVMVVGVTGGCFLPHDVHFSINFYQTSDLRQR
jgi:hypothetical protein